jgi:F-type H+-transporting ATPase subunit alpha
LFAVNQGYFDEVDVKRALDFELGMRQHVKSKYGDLYQRIEDTKSLTAEDEKLLAEAIEDFVKNGAY